MRRNIDAGITLETAQYSALAGPMLVIKNRDCSDGGEVCSFGSRASLPWTSKLLMASYGQRQPFQDRDWSLRNIGPRWHAMDHSDQHDPFRLERHFLADTGYAARCQRVRIAFAYASFNAFVRSSARSRNSGASPITRSGWYCFILCR